MKDIILPNGLHVISDFERWQFIYDIHMKAVVKALKEQNKFDLEVVENYMNAWGRIFDAYRRLDVTNCLPIYKEFQYTQTGSFSKKTVTCICTKTCAKPSDPTKTIYMQLLLSPKQESLEALSPDFPYQPNDDKVATLYIALRDKPVSMPPIWDM